jgi:hypothetical protein
MVVSAVDTTRVSRAAIREPTPVRATIQAVVWLRTGMAELIRGALKVVSFRSGTEVTIPDRPRIHRAASNFGFYRFCETTLSMIQRRASRKFEKPASPVRTPATTLTTDQLPPPGVRHSYRRPSGSV